MRQLLVGLCWSMCGSAPPDVPFTGTAMQSTGDMDKLEQRDAKMVKCLEHII